MSTSGDTGRLDKIRARLDAATPGPWAAQDWDDPQFIRVVQQRPFPDPSPTLATCGFESDARFIAHAHADIAWLLAEVERLRERESLASDGLLPDACGYCSLGYIRYEKSHCTTHGDDIEDYLDA